MDNKSNTQDISLDEILNSIPDDIPASADVSSETAGDISEPPADADEAAVESEFKDAESGEAEEQPAENETEGVTEDGSEEEAYEDSEEEYEEEKPRKKKKHRKRKKRRGPGRVIFGLVFTTIVIGAAFLCSAYVIKFAKEFLGIGKSDVEIVIEVPMNSSTEDIANQLLSEGIIDNTYLFRFYSRVKGSDGTFVAGPHTLTPDMTYEDMVEELQKGVEDVRETVDIVFQEGITILGAAKKLEEAGVCNADEFIRAFNTSDYGYAFEENVKVSSLKFYKMEGYLFPDTYTFYLEEDARIVAKKFCKNFNLKITADIYGRMEDLGMELEELLTLASMVQAEASRPSDMKKVASVFLNRLENPDEYPLLQSDPTRKYVEDVIIPNIEIQSEKMYEAYNTYEGSGLPAGPICNPGLDAINAVLYPAETDYYYFCANVETGEVFYAETNEQHEENLALAGITLN
ncbi:MAG: endolytic transglycosylase MltG [Oscillospiraceae bacterium]|nr:endolytic transglycosylase MltG [Oscillospiraceae bacterium]